MKATKTPATTPTSPKMPCEPRAAPEEGRVAVGEVTALLGLVGKADVEFPVPDVVRLPRAVMVEVGWATLLFPNGAVVSPGYEADLTTTAVALAEPAEETACAVAIEVVMERFRPEQLDPLPMPKAGDPEQAP